MSTLTTSKRKKPSSSASASAAAAATSAKQPENRTHASPKSRSHRVFTEEDEIHLLDALRRATKSNKPSSSPPPPLSALIGRDFSDGQITDKLRRLRQRYHKLARTKSLMKTPRDRKIYEMGRKIWGKKPKESPPRRRRESKSIYEEDREEVDLAEFPALMREVSRIIPEIAVYREGLERLGRDKLRSLNEKWMVQRMEEAGLLAKQAELFCQQTKLELESVIRRTNSK